MQRSPLTYFIIFCIAWLILSYSVGHFDIMCRRPMSVHQGAQCDRACIAQNYYQEGMNFFKPEVNEVIGGTGYVGCEFPLMNYSAAVCYKLFGFHEFWYRLLMYLVVSAGMYGAFRILLFYLRSVWISLLCLGLFYLSPILVFYTANFLPDAAALGFMLIAWFYFFRHIETPKRSNFICFALFSGLAIAIKITSAIGLCVLTCIMALDAAGLLSKDRQQQVKGKKYWCTAILAAALLSYSWYAYAGYLSRTYTSQYFMMGIPWSENMEQFKEAFHVYWGNWPGVTYVKPLFYVFGALLVLLPLTYKRVNRMLFWVAVFYALGSIGFFLLMIQQFKYHDYYVLTLLPLFFFLILAWADWLKHAGRPFWWLRISAVVLLLTAVCYSHGQTAKHIEERYTDGNYWQQSFQQPADYEGLDTLLANRFHITRKSRVVVAYDANPNNMLYFLNLRGYRVNKDHDTNRVKWIYGNYKPSHLILSDSSFFTDHPLDSVSYKELYRNKAVKVYSISYQKP